MNADATIEARSWLKRFSHRSRFDVALELLALRSGERVLDYGAGEGFLLERIRHCNVQCRLVGYEPVPEMYAKLWNRQGAHASPQLTLVNSLDALPAQSFDTICCFEVLEHVSEENQERELGKMSHLLANHGKLIISVPLEAGLSSLFKNIVRLLLRQTHPNTNMKNVIYSLFGLKIDRTKGMPGHIGFYYQDLSKKLNQSSWKITRTVFSPFNPLGGFFNSQVFFVLRKSS